LREKEIEECLQNEELKISARNVLGVKKNNDWVNYLNIDNIMYLSSLNFDDLDLESDAKFELLRDAVVEKVNIVVVIRIDSYVDCIIFLFLQGG
jgi:hypothetical protein